MLRKPFRCLFLHFGLFFRCQLSCGRIASPGTDFLVCSIRSSSSKVQPKIGFSEALRDTLAAGVENAEIVLCVCVALVRSFAIPRGSLGVILRDSSPKGVYPTQIELCLGKALIRSLAI